MRNLRVILVWGLVLLLGPAVLASVVTTRQGKVYEGEAHFTAGGKVAVATTRGGVTLELSEIDDAIFSGRVKVRVAGSQPALEWVSQDVGEVAKAGSVDVKDGRITIYDGGRGLRDARKGGDGFYYVYQKLNGDGEIVGRALWSENARTERVGFMIREGLEAEANFVMVSRGGEKNGGVDKNASAMLARLGATGSGGEGALKPSSVPRRGANAAARAPKNNDGQIVTGGEGERLILGATWLKLVRVGDKFTGFDSADGKKWNSLGMFTLPMGGEKEVYIGIAAASATGGGGGDAVFESLFDQVVVTGGSATAPPGGLPRGLVTRGGSVLACAIDSVGAETIGFHREGGGAQKIAVKDVSRVVAHGITKDMGEKLREAGTGVLLMKGDFVEGEVQSLTSGVVKLSSVIFGLEDFDMAKDVAAVTLRPVAEPEYVVAVRLRDRSLLRVMGAKLDRDGTAVILTDVLLGEVKVNVEEVVEVIGKPKAGN